MTLVPITNSDYRLDAIYDARFTAWGAYLSKSQFFEREKVLSKTKWATNGLQTWALISEQKEILASCETFPISMVTNGRSLRGQLIASVVVEQCRRKQGFASELLRQLISNLKVDCEFLALHSEVGPTLYSKLGFQPYPMTSFSISTEKAASFPPTGDPLSKAEALQLLCSARETKLVDRLEPLEHHIEWHWDRSAFYANSLNREMQSVFGFGSKDSFVIASNDYKFNKMRVLSSNRGPLCTDPEWLGLWNSLIRAAKHHELGEITGWCNARAEVEIEPLAGSFEIKTGLDADDLPMILGFKNVQKQIEIEHQCWA